MIVLIDNYDSFTWNLWHFLSDLGAEVKTIRNDAASCAKILAMKPHGIVISPGPGVPKNAGMIEDLIRAAAGTIPVLGVCLGHQAICTAFGGKLTHFAPPMHGKLSRIQHDNTGVFEGVADNFIVTRYHSLIADEEHIPDVLSINARTEMVKSWVSSIRNFRFLVCNSTQNQSHHLAATVFYAGSLNIQAAII